MIDYFIVTAFLVGYVVCWINTRNAHLQSFRVNLAVHSAGLIVSLGFLYMMIVITNVAGV